MSSKRGSKSSKISKSKTETKKNKNKKKKEDFSEKEDEVEEFCNSEEEYCSMSGGETDTEASTELGPDTTTHDLDLDEGEPNEDDKFNPVEDTEELEDPDEEKVEVEEVEEEKGEEPLEAADEEAIAENEEGETFTGEAKACYLKNLNKDFIVVMDEDDSSMYGKMEYTKIPDDERESDPILTYYEIVRIIGTRAQQFNFGAQPLVKGLEGLHPAKMAYLELIAKMTPFIIRRHLPGKKYEEWRVDELEMIHIITDDFFVPEHFDYDALMKQAKEFNKKFKNEVIEDKDDTKTKKITRKAIASSSRVKGSKSNKSKSSSKSSKTKKSSSKSSKTKKSSSKSSKTKKYK